MILPAVTAPIVWAREQHVKGIGEESVVPGVSDTNMLIVYSLALGVHIRYPGTRTCFGALGASDHENASVGVNRRGIRLIACGDGHGPPCCVANNQKPSIEDKVFGLLN